ncbi:SCAN domain-containing protein 3-like [Gordionus sp. m RMFG-2023]|uniref:SCAN domain-containing protein 3-like n=1 Tax=Gordionus sp. m RMFG-2023 TaxID=3053472 RepID=UPI0031FBC9B4
MWPGCKIMHGRRKDSISHGLVERANKDIMNKLRCFLHDNKTTCWANALGTIQFQKNISYHRGIKSSPYEVMFGHKPNIWDSSLTKKLEDTGDDTAYLDDDKSYFHNLVNYTDSEDSDEFENNSNSIREDCITPDPVDFENNSNSIREDCITPDPAECEKNHKSVQIYCPSPDLATEDDTIRKHINAIKKIRKISKEGLLLQATKMKRDSDKKLKPGEIGDSVLLPIPPVDQGRLDHKMLLGVITDKSTDGFYKLGTSRGHLSGHYARSQFDLAKKNYINVGDVPPSCHTFRTMVGMSSIGSGQGFKRCHCKQNCRTNRCKCKASNVSCNSHCHTKNNLCQNK